jgi:hypothetical protein
MVVSKHKRYLTGSDWAINTLDCMMKLTTCSGNMSQIVLMLNGPLLEDEVRLKLDHFVRQFPVLQGHITRDIKLAPYWKIPKSAIRETPINISNVAGAPCDAELMTAVTRSANRSFRDDREHLAFHLVNGVNHCAIAMAFDHRIFDARGAESFLNLFNQSLHNNSSYSDIAFKSSAELTEWKRKFLAGRNINRRLIALSKSAPRALPVKTGSDKGFTYRLISFTEEETAAIYDDAYREAGYLMESPYLLSVITKAMHALLRQMSGDGSSYVIPVTIDARNGKDPLQEIFFNHLSYLFYQIPVEQADNLKGLISMFKQQMYDQVKSGFPGDLAEASLLTRIAPLRLFGKIMHIPLKGRIATFAFSHLGRSSYESDDFMGVRVNNLFHMPRVPAPPGLGFFSNYYNKKLNIVISCLDGLLGDDKTLMLESEIRKGFGTSSK